MTHLYRLVEQGHAALERDDPDTVMAEVGKMLHEGWMTKRGLSPMVSTPLIDEIYETCMKCGAYGGKLCGAGGGGFLFVLVPQQAMTWLQHQLGDRNLIPIRIDETGSTVVRS